MPETKYYHALNASQPVSAGGIRIPFECYEHNATWMGVFATDEQSKIDILDVLVNTETSPVTAITKAEYEQCLKKKSHGQTYLIPSQQTPDSSLNQKVVEAVSVAALGEAIDPTEPGSQPQIGAPLDSLDDALIIGKVNA